MQIQFPSLGATPPVWWHLSVPSVVLGYPPPFHFPPWPPLRTFVVNVGRCSLPRPQFKLPSIQRQPPTFPLHTAALADTCHCHHWQGYAHRTGYRPSRFPHHLRYAVRPPPPTLGPFQKTGRAKTCRHPRAKGFADRVWQLATRFPHCPVSPTRAFRMCPLDTTWGHAA